MTRDGNTFNTHTLITKNTLTNHFIVTSVCLKPETNILTWIRWHMEFGIPRQSGCIIIPNFEENKKYSRCLQQDHQKMISHLASKILL